MLKVFTVTVAMLTAGIAYGGDTISKREYTRAMAIYASNATEGVTVQCTPTNRDFFAIVMLEPFNVVITIRRALASLDYVQSTVYSELGVEAFGFDKGLRKLYDKHCPQGGG